jgi:hypothetical protein
MTSQLPTSECGPCYCSHLVPICLPCCCAILQDMATPELCVRGGGRFCTYVLECLQPLPEDRPTVAQLQDEGNRVWPFDLTVAPERRNWRHPGKPVDQPSSSHGRAASGSTRPVSAPSAVHDHSKQDQPSYSTIRLLRSEASRQQASYGQSAGPVPDTPPPWRRSGARAAAPDRRPSPPASAHGVASAPGEAAAVSSAHDAGDCSVGDQCQNSRYFHNSENASHMFVAVVAFGLCVCLHGHLNDHVAGGYFSTQCVVSRHVPTPFVHFVKVRVCFP